MESQITAAMETAKSYGTAAIEKATELGEQVMASAKEAIHELQEQAEAHGLTSKPSAGPLSPAEEKKLDDALANRPT